MIPKDPVMLLSFMNLKLRDFYSSLDAFCEDMDVDKQEIVDKLAAIEQDIRNQINQLQLPAPIGDDPYRPVVVPPGLPAPWPSAASYSACRERRPVCGE